MRSAKIKKSFGLAVAVLLTLGMAQSSLAGVIVIANEDVPVGSLSDSDLKNIYLGKKTFWNSDVKITLTVLKEGGVHESFLKDYVGKTPEQFKNYWNKILFTGAGTPPTPFSSEADLVDYVKKTRGAIGYIDSQTSHQGVRVIDIR